MSDEQTWIAGIRAGRLEAFDALYRAIVPSLLNFAHQLAPQIAADDVIQDVMLDFWERREDLQVRGSVRGYLFGAVRHRITDELRHAKVVHNAESQLASADPHIPGPFPSPPATPLAHTETNELRQAIREAIATLPPRSRLILILRWDEGLTYPEIAEALGISLAAAKKQGQRMEVVMRALLTRFTPSSG